MKTVPVAHVLLDTRHLYKVTAPKTPCGSDAGTDKRTKRSDGGAQKQTHVESRAGVPGQGRDNPLSTQTKGVKLGLDLLPHSKANPRHTADLSVQSKASKLRIKSLMTQEWGKFLLPTNKAKRLAID